MTKYEKPMDGGLDIYYETFEDGFDIWIGRTDGYPAYTQRIPNIPDPSKSFEENAKDMCAFLTTPQESGKGNIDDRLTSVEANIDYLMLLNDPDSASETVTE